MRKLVVGIVAVATAGMLYAGGHIGGNDRGSNMGMNMPVAPQGMAFDGGVRHQHNVGLFGDLNLTTTQQTQIRQIHIDSMATMADEHNRTDTALKNATKNGYFDKSLFIAELTAGSTTRITNMADTMEKIYNVLTDSQKALLKQ
jgi:Spy/CpxP family protein refolding chaperone